MTSRLFRVSAVFLLLIPCVACSTSQSSGPQSMQGAMAGEPLGDYRLRPGDEIALKFFNHHDFDCQRTVGPDGKISLQLIDQVLVAGLTASQVDEIVSAEYAKHLTNVEITVIMERYAGLKAFVGGEVREPGFVSLKGNLTVLQAVLERQGFKDTAKPENVIILRKGPGSQATSMVVDLQTVIAGEQIENDVYLLPSDIVYVPKTTIAKAGDFVHQYLAKVLMVDTFFRGAWWALGYFSVGENVYGIDYSERD